MELIVPSIVLALRYIVWLSVLSFGLWLYRRTDFRSLPYLGLHWLFRCPLVDVANSWIAEHWIKDQFLLKPVIDLSQAKVHTQWFAWLSLFASLTGLLLIMLLLSDVVALLSKTGVTLDNKAVRLLLPLRNSSFALGLTAIALETISHFMWLLIIIK